MQTQITNAQLATLISLIEKKAYCSPYHEEPANEFIESLQEQFEAPHSLRVITEHLPYAFLDAIADMPPAERERLEDLFRAFVKTSVDQILEFEMSEY